MRKFSVNLEDEIVADLDRYVAKEAKRTGLRITRSGIIASLVRSGIRNRTGEGRLPKVEEK